MRDTVICFENELKYKYFIEGSKVLLTGVTNVTSKIQTKGHLDFKKYSKNVISVEEFWKVVGHF